MFVDTRVGGCPRYYLDQPRDGLMLVPDEVRKCVVYLGVSTGTGDEAVWTCTGFLVAVPVVDNSDSLSIYLVTVRHHADKLKGRKFLIRMNTLDGYARTIHVNEDHHWYRHPTEPDSVDAAVLPLGMLGDEFDYKVILKEMFLTDEIIEQAFIGPGDEVFMTGLFTRIKGKRNVPIVRTGNVSAIPDDLITITISGEVVDSEIYLIEARSMGGISGSPIFVCESVRTTTTRASDWKKGDKMNLFSRGPFYLMGLMHGHWEIKPSEQNRYDFESGRRDESVALGIAVVVPAKKILEVIYQPELVRQRKGSWQITMSPFGTVSE